MIDKSRRSFILKMGKAAGAALLWIVPGSFFRRGWARNVRDKMTVFESILRKTNKENVYEVLEGVELKPEEKFAIASVRELKREEVKMVIQPGQDATDAGTACGMGCGGSCGRACGVGCNVAPNAMGVVDRKGLLGFKKGIILNKDLFISALEKAYTLIY